MEVEHQKIIGETPTSVLSLVLLLLILPFLCYSSQLLCLVLAQHPAYASSLCHGIRMNSHHGLCSSIPLYVEIIRHYSILDIDKMFKHLSDVLILKSGHNNKIRCGQSRFTVVST